ncbi:hypothetical protein ACWEOZ_15395 [Actinoplanes sp. NPDC004185]
MTTAFEYFVSFNAVRPDGPTFGNFTLTLPAPITSIDHIRGLERVLRKDGHDHAIVLGYHLLRTIEAHS